MICPICKRDVDAYRAAHWTCPKCGKQSVACFMCHPQGSAYVCVDHDRTTHVCAPPVCQDDKPKLELVP